MLTDERFEALAAKYIDMVYRVAFGALKNREDAEDVTQEVLIKLYREKRDFESMEHVKRWLIRVTVNQSRKLFRSPWRRVEPLEDYAEMLGFEQPEDRGALPRGHGPGGEIPPARAALLLRGIFHG